MTSHCAGTVQMREKSESEKRCDLKRQQKMERGGWQQWRAMEDCSTDERLQQETFCHRPWTDEYVERLETLMRQNVVVVWLQCLLVNVVCHAGKLAPDHVGICTTKLRPYRWGAQRPLIQPVKSSEQRADVVEPQRREYQPSGCIHCRLKSLQTAWWEQKQSCDQDFTR